MEFMLTTSNQKEEKKDSHSGNGWKIEKKENSDSVRCESWNGFLDFLHHEKALRQNNGYVYRGHASENWKLESTLKRKSEETGAKDIDKQILASFQKHTLGRRGHNPPKLTESEWWALGQHFGLDTPLLDWSDSPYVAAFFAFNSDNTETENVVVWLLSKGVNKNEGVKKLKTEHHIEFLRPYLDENARLINQRGLFVRTPKMECITEWAKSLKDDGIFHLVRILIPRSEKDFALDSLDKMNINEFTLFPDISGAAKYANYIASRDAQVNKKDT
jgi:hypothetical protein